MDVDVERFSVPLAEPLVTAEGTIEERTGFLVRVGAHATTDAGSESVVGVGEATPLPGWTESIDECRSALDDARTVLASDGPERALAALTGAPAARHGLALALADRRARTAGEPLYRSLGARRSGAAAGRDASIGPVESVPCNATIGDGPPAATAAAGERAVDAGFDCCKVKVGARALDADRERLAAVREAVGPEPALRVDANGAWSPSAAADALDRFAAYDVEYVEQPVPADDLDASAALTGGPIDVALDESVATDGLDAILAADAADVVVCKPMVLGGPERTLAVAERAIDAGLDVVVSTTIDAVVARTSAVHVAAALAPLRPCGLATAERLGGDLAPDPAPVTDGAIRVPQTSGTGVDPDAIAVTDGS